MLTSFQYDADPLLQALPACLTLNALALVLSALYLVRFRFVSAVGGSEEPEILAL